jgi:hypothetical protein
MSEAFNEVLQGAIKTAEVMGVNFALMRDVPSNTQIVIPLESFACSPKDHEDLAAYTKETVCQICRECLYSDNG